MSKKNLNFGCITMTWVLFFLGAFGACKKLNKSDVKIVGGATAGNVSAEDLQIQEQVVRSTVSLLTASGRVFCSGTLVDASHVVTAAHCKEFESGQSSVGFGYPASLGNAVPVSKFVIHENYRADAKFSAEDDNFDIAVVTLAGAVPAGYGPAVVEDSQAKSRAVVAAGFGADKATGSGGSAVLSGKGELRFVKQTAEVAAAKKFVVKARGICQGDSGGPLYQNANGKLALVGVTSFFQSTTNCEAARATFFTSVFEYRNWIERNK